MQARIQKLAPNVINQIAAGEVIERPASVIKELLENSLDAKARHIQVDIGKGGKQLIRVSDDGVGIAADDLPLAVAAHATSKIIQFEDLTEVASLGFRGEALASVSSVSRFTLTSCQAGTDAGWQIVCHHDGTPLTPQPAAHPVGTSVTVEELFFNTPVRRKFLRMDKTEFSHVEEVVKRLAISHFDVGVKLTHDKRVIWQVHPASTMAEQEARVRQLLGKAFVEQATYFDIERHGMRLWGWVGSPDYFRSQTDQQYFYLNQRLVKDKLINHAIRQVYAELLYPGRHAAYVLFLTMPRAWVDVNVHPTKTEVRFQQSRMIHDFLVGSLGHVLHEPASHPQQTLDVVTHSPIEQPAGEQTPMEQKVDKSITVDDRQLTLATMAPPPLSSATRTPPLYVKQPQAAYTTASVANTGSASGRAIAQIAKRFIVAHVEDDLLVYDYSRGKALLTCRQLQRAYAENKIKTRPLLVPVTLEATAAVLDNFSHFASHWSTLGWQVELSGQDQLLLRDIPICLGQADVAFVFKQIVAYLVMHDEVDRDALLQLMARHSVVLQPLTMVAMNDFLTELTRETSDIAELEQQGILRRLTEPMLQQYFTQDD
jgi:DNA mismatch repair protein MutL